MRKQEKGEQARHPLSSSVQSHRLIHLSHEDTALRRRVCPFSPTDSDWALLIYVAPCTEKTYAGNMPAEHHGSSISTMAIAIINIIIVRCCSSLEMLALVG